MRIRQIIIPAILALGAAGSILAGSAAPAMAAPAHTGVHVVAAAPRTHYYDLVTIALLSDDAGGDGMMLYWPGDPGPREAGDTAWAAFAKAVHAAAAERSQDENPPEDDTT